MRRMKRAAMLALLCVVAISAPARDEFYSEGLFHAAWTPFQFVLMPDVQLFDSKTEVRGISLCCSANIGRNAMYGWSLAPLCARMGESRGVEMSVVNVSALSDSKIAMSLLNIASPYRGQTPVQFGLINVTTHGWQFGIFNYNKRALIPFTLFFNYGATPDAIHPLDESDEEDETKTEKENENE